MTWKIKVMFENRQPVLEKNQCPQISAFGVSENEVSKNVGKLMII